MLLWATQQGHFCLVQLLIAEGADPNSKSEDNKSLLMGSLGERGTGSR
ncbi:MAG: hypothetical protein AB7I41_10975 [Candidatus Sericytochromatia bacterium]